MIGSRDGNINYNHHIASLNHCVDGDVIYIFNTVRNLGKKS